ncbi:hypothetical protein HHK36_001265 [Tetracentron sinense]|uniref:Uncharacterized protein n=1 Tax=Tetracentron sinense TaxID=13715 RepID=A0A834ZT10_TETSI|nr:hypothetical protein HHK36_001265 [Tetracentron sinense]
MAAGSATGSGLFKFLRPGLHLQSTDIQAAATWGVAATAGALWIIQNSKVKDIQKLNRQLHHLIGGQLLVIVI